MMSGVGAPSPEVVAGRQRAHQARQVRARIVGLAQEYREACRQHEEVCVYIMSLVTPPDVLRLEERRIGEEMEQRREALFGAVEELAGLEEEGP